MPSINSKQLFASVLFLGAVVVLAVQLINPSTVMVTAGENGGEVVELDSYFQYRDVGVIALSACLLGASATYLLTATDTGTTDTESVSNHSATPQHDSSVSPDGGNQRPSDELLEARKEEWEDTAERLANKEREVYEQLLEADGVLPQSEVVDTTDLSKASVSRALDSLEVKDLVERKRRGVGNVVLLL